MALYINLFLWKRIWCVKVATKVAFFTWKAARGKRFSQWIIFIGNVCIVEWCCMHACKCKRHGGVRTYVGHLLFHWEFASYLRPLLTVVLSVWASLGYAEEGDGVVVVSMHLIYDRWCFVCLGFTGLCQIGWCGCYMACWNGSFGRYRSADLWRPVPLCLTLGLHFT